MVKIAFVFCCFVIVFSCMKYKTVKEDTFKATDKVKEQTILRNDLLVDDRSFDLLPSSTMRQVVHLTYYSLS